MVKTSINIPDGLLEQVRTHNEKHPDSSINVSGVCRLALEAALDAKKYYTNGARADDQHDDFDKIRNQWFTKNQQRILETTGKMEPNWNNILVKNPELGFKNSKELKNWILDRASAERTEQGTEQDPEPTTGQSTDSQAASTVTPRPP